MKNRSKLRRGAEGVLGEIRLPQTLLLRGFRLHWWELGPVGPSRDDGSPAVIGILINRNILLAALPPPAAAYFTPAQAYL